MNLLKWPPTYVLILITVIMGVGAVLVFSNLMQPRADDLKMTRGYGPIDLQMSYARCPDAKTVLDRWDDDARRIARESLLLDFVLIACYTLLGASLMLLVVRGFDGRWQSAALYGIWLTPFAGLCDVAENLCELGLLTTPYGAEPCKSLIGVAAVATTLKWGALYFFLFAFPLLLIVCIWKKLRARKRDRADS